MLEEQLFCRYKLNICNSLVETVISYTCTCIKDDKHEDVDDFKA